MRRFCWAAAAAVLALSFGGGIGVGDDKEEAAKKELKALEGDWQLTRQEERGSLTPRPVVARLRIVIEGDQMSWYIGNPAPNQTADLKVDPTKNPRTIDAEITRGSAKDKKMLGIYRLGKDSLEICWGEPGSGKRPTKFTSRPGVGSGNVLCRYQREKDQKDEAGGKKDRKEPAPKDERKKQAFDPRDIRTLQATLPDGWKDDGTILDVRRFLKDRLCVFAILYRGEAPRSAEALAELARKNPDLFPHREWIKTVGIGKLPDGCFIVGKGKAGGFEQDALGMVRTIDGKTVLFLGAPADEAGARKEMLAIARSAQFGEPAPKERGK
jgi:uncharacterized protein (TIGR03067 family)